MQKQKIRPVGLAMFLILLAAMLVGAFRMSVLLNRAAAQGTTYQTELLPLSSWGWGSKNWKGQLFGDFEDTDCTSGLFSRGGCLCRYHPFAVGPVQVMKRTERAYP